MTFAWPPRRTAILANLRSELRHDSFQACFHARWSSLHDPHVRALAWLIDAPDLLDPVASQWGGQIATLPPDSTVAGWLSALDNDPSRLTQYLALRPFERLGRYAEKLMAFYFLHLGTLVAHGVQVHAGDRTIGEFDYLLREGAALVHWEFATKLYLLESSASGGYFVGPNLADTLLTKMGKILDRQLALGQHPAAQTQLPEPIDRAEALIKGWLFYHGDDLAPAALGLHPAHCRGWWCTLAEASTIESYGSLMLSRLQWLAPQQVAAEKVLDGRQTLLALQAHFSVDSRPVVVALMQAEGAVAREVSRGFVVPNDWRERAGQRAQRSFISAA